jgi:hypothetical protein
MEYKLTDLVEDDCCMTLQEWKIEVEWGGFIDYDGYGYFATKTQESDIQVSPSDYWDGSKKTVNVSWVEPDWATHIVWYNR